MILTSSVVDFEPTMHIAGVNVRWLDTMLLLLRHPQKSYGNHWGVPAGKKEPSETVVEAAARELYEETSIKVRVEELVYIATYRVRHGGCDFYCSSFEYLFESKPIVLLKPNEHIDYRWIQPEKALNLALIPDADYCIRDYFRIPQTDCV